MFVVVVTVTIVHCTQWYNISARIIIVSSFRYYEVKLFEKNTFKSTSKMDNP